MVVSDVGISVDVKNAMVNNEAVRTLLRFLAISNVEFDADRLIRALATSLQENGISAQLIMGAAKAGGVALKGARLAFVDLATMQQPFLTFLQNPSDSTRYRLVEIRRCTPNSVAIIEEGMRRDMAPQTLEPTWTGIVLYTSKHHINGDLKAAKSYRKSVQVVPHLLSSGECVELINHLNTLDFRRSKVFGTSKDGQIPGVRSATRTSYSVTIGRAQFGVLDRLKKRILELDGREDMRLETLQAVRYQPGQKFNPHYDSSRQAPRRTTYLIYLNEDFNGGETYFPMLDLAVVPQAGSCLRFDNCDDSGALMWQSEHGGMPVENGTKYAINAWMWRV